MAVQTYSLPQYRAFAAQQLGGFWRGVATSGSLTTLLEDTAWPIFSSLSQDDLYEGYWLYRPAAAAAGDAVRIVKLYSPATGTLTPDKAYTNNPYANGTGEAYELHGIIRPYDPSTAGTNESLLSLLNEALKRILLDVEITLIPTSATAQRHSLATLYPWLTDLEWVRQVGVLNTAEVRNDRDPYLRVVRGQADQDRGQVWLAHPGQSFSPTTDVIYVKTMKRAYDMVIPASPAVTETDGVTTTGKATITSASGPFTQADVGLPISGSGIPSGTTILSVQSATSATLSANATATATGVSITITRYQSGLSAEGDTCAADLAWVGWTAVTEAWQRYSHMIETSARGRLVVDRQEAAAMVTKARNKHYYEPPLTFRPLIGTGLRSGGLKRAFSADLFP